MCKNNFDLCVANCEECNGINVEKIKEEGIYKCLNTGKTLKIGEEPTTLREYSMVDLYLENEGKDTCFDCGQSMVTDEDKLYCPIKQTRVDDNGTCEECNC